MAEAEKVLFREVKQYRAYWRPKNYGAITMESPQEFLVVTDLLRHEKPVYFSTKTGALSTGREPVGEAE
jgi:hypothetical protein